MKVDNSTPLEPFPPSAPSPQASAVYLRALSDSEFTWEGAKLVTGLEKDEIAGLRDELIACHLLNEDPAGRLVPVNPEIAAAMLSEPLERAIRSHRQAAEDVREQLLRFMPAYLSRTVSATSYPGLEVITDPAQVQLLVDHFVATCAQEMVTVQPGGYRPVFALEEALPKDVAAARRGVRVRILYQHTTRSQLTIRSYVSAMAEAGGEVRTTDQLADRMFIFDREVAFIPKRTAPDQAPGALVVREPVLIAFLCALFEQFWVTAVPYTTEGPGYRNVSDSLRRSIVELLGQGLKDEAVAKRLGMSVRTCRRHIASLMQELEAESRFEAGVKAARLGWLDEGSVSEMSTQQS